MAFAPPIALDYLRRAHAAGRLGHAYLLVGDDTAGFDLAAGIAALVVRAGPEGALKHQDVHVVEPESKARRILIDQVRELENALRLRASAVGGRKVGIIRQADRINTQAANAFLKTLEEPPADSILLLVSSLPESLPETILSRCIKVVLHTGDTERAASPEEVTLYEALDRFARERTGGQDGALPTAYGLLREFSTLLSAARSRLQEEADAALEVEEERYRQTTDGGWLSEREAYYKSLVEARYVAVRARLVESLARWWGDVLRHQTTGGSADVAPGVDSLVLQLYTADILRRLSALELLRENLDRNIQEALALEVAFLQAFGT